MEGQAESGWLTEIRVPTGLNKKNTPLKPWSHLKLCGFSGSQSLGYYSDVSAPPGFMSLTVPSRLGEVELVLALEILISVNASVILPLPETTTTSLSITLKRTQSCESEYISAGSRILSAARIPQPKLIVHYTSVNSSREQVFKLDLSSARRWLRHNHLWASEMWTH